MELGDFTAGETLRWQAGFARHRPADGWTVEYFFANREYSTSVAAREHDPLDTTGLFYFELASDDSADFRAGLYAYQAWAVKDDERFLVCSGRVRVEASLEDAATIDDRSDAEKNLDAIDAVLAGRITKDVAAYQIGNRQLTKIPIADLLKLRGTYAAIVAAEQLQKNGGQIQVGLLRFTR